MHAMGRLCRVRLRTKATTCRARSAWSGSPEVRSAKPSAGLLSDGDPTPAAARNFNSVVNNEWDAPSSSRPSHRGGIDAESTMLVGQGERPARARRHEQGPAVFLWSGAVAVGHRRRQSAGTNVGDFSAPRPVGTATLEIAAGIVGDGLLAFFAPSVRESGVTEYVQPAGIHDVTEFPASVFSGLGLATVFTLNAVLSQPIAGFDYLILASTPTSGHARRARHRGP